MKTLKGLFMMGLIVAGLAVSQTGRAQEARDIITTEGKEALNTKTGETVCLSLRHYLGVVDSSPVLEYVDGAACNVGEGGLIMIK